MSAPVTHEKALATTHGGPKHASRNARLRPWHRIWRAIREMDDADRRVAELNSSWAYSERPRPR